MGTIDINYNLLIFIVLLCAGLYWYKHHPIKSNFAHNFVQPPTQHTQNMRNTVPHPVLAYQQQASQGTVPASWGDPIRPPPSPVGPPTDTTFIKTGVGPFGVRAYGTYGTGPHPGELQR